MVSKDNPFFLGTDKLSVHRVRELMLLLLSLGVLSWFAVNIPNFFEVSRVWLILGLFAAVAISFSFIIKKIGNFNLNMPLAETGFLKIDRKYIFMFALVIFLVTFFFVGRSQYSIFAPKFQVIECDILCNTFLSIPTAIIENQVFFSVFYGLIFSFVLLYTRSPLLALVISTFIMPLLFLAYHTLQYGFQDVVSSTAVVLFGIEQIAIMLLLRDMIVIHARHIGNNFAKELFSQMTLTTFFITLFSSWVFWVAVVILVLGIVMWVRVLRKKNVKGLR